MNKLIATTFAAGLILAGAASDAFARERSVTATGRNGHSVSRDFQSGCADGTCSRSRSVTGPASRTRSGSESVSRNGDGTLSVEREGAGRRGGTYSGSGSTDGNGGYAYSGTTTRPDGSTVTRDRTVTHDK